jgi:1-acyl-sn-glycerol-3-phosphate acyltransferase
MKALASLWLTVSFYTGLVLFSLVAVPFFALVVTPIGLTAGHRAALRRIRRSISWYGKVVIYVLPFPWIRVRYRELKPHDVSGPALWVCNHRSSSDPFLLAVVPDEGVQVVNRWPFRLPLWGPVARLAGYLSVRELSVESFLEQSTRLLQEGVSIGAFPEGTRSGGRAMGPFHGTVFRLALATRVPIVPLAISGNERMPPRGTIRLYPGVVRIHRLPALTWDEYKDLSPFQLKNRVRDRIAAELVRMEGPP